MTGISLRSSRAGNLATALASRARSSSASASGAPREVGERIAQGDRVVPRHRPFATETRLGDGSVEEPVGLRRAHQVVDRDAAGGDPEDRDLVGVAAEPLDVVLHPLQGGDLVEQPEVGDRLLAALLRLGLERRVGEVAEPAEPVAHRDQHDSLVDQALGHLERQGAGAGLQAAAMDPHHDRQVGADVGRPVDVEVEAVLHRVRVQRLLSGLEAGRAELLRLQRARPVVGRLRRAPPQVADRRGGVRDAEPVADAVGLLTHHRPGVGAARPAGCAESRCA